MSAEETKCGLSWLSILGKPEVGFQEAMFND